ncbi:MAG: photosynthetic reaction center cytochrome c subunit [Acidobacteria bacterium]|nr:photosynthetic reaction center cytochrome c subunit [Acidobacteriota bacterium]
MKHVARRAVHCATAVAVVCLIGTMMMAVGRAQGAADTPALTDTTFKNVMLLKGIPVDTFLDAMGMFANAMGNDCTYCHASDAALNRDAFAVATPRIQRARQMIVMMNAINKSYFAGQPRVTCFTCHGGNQSPRSDPNLALQYSTPPEDPNVRDFPTDPTGNVDQIFDRYLQAVGGAARLAALKSFTAKGTYEGFDTLFAKVPVDIYAQAPNRYNTTVHMSSGDSVRVYNGTGGWMAGPDTAIPLLTLSSGNLDRARLEALVAFPTGLKQAFPQWRVGRAVMNDQEVRVVQASENGQPVVNLYFDESGLLVRLVRWTLTPVGFVPTQIDYSDFKDVAGVKIPFVRKVSQTYMQMTVELSDVQPNTNIDAARFARPAPAKPAV